MAGGFKGPLFLLGLGSAAVVAQAGYVGPLPVVNLGGRTAVTQAGFIGPIPLVNLGAGQATIEEAQPDNANRYLLHGNALDIQRRREDDEIFVFIQAFLHVKGRR